MPQPTLFLFAGFPGAGKTTFTRNLSVETGIPRESYGELRHRKYPDDEVAIDRLAVLGALEDVCAEHLRTGSSVICDSNAYKRGYRRGPAAVVARCAARAILVVVETPLEISKKREAERAPYDRMTPKRYQEIVGGMELPEEDEAAMTISGQAPFREQYESFCKQLEIIDAAGTRR